MSSLSSAFFAKGCNPQPSAQTAMSGKVMRRTPEWSPNVGRWG